MYTRILAADHSCRRIEQFENHPAMPALLAELSPRAVAALFQEVGVVDATVLMSMMPTRALLHAFDESIWKSATPGSPRTIDYRDLVDWLTAWSEIDEQFLVDKLAAMDEDYLTTLLSRIVDVESASRYAAYWEDRESFVGLCEDDRERIGPYIVQPVVEQDREIVVGAVRALWSFDARKLLSTFARLSDLPDPADSPRGSATTSQDIESARDSFGESRGFVSGEGARAFFAYAKRLTASDIDSLDAYDPETRRHLEVIARASEADAAQTNPVVCEDLQDEADSDNDVVVDNGAVANSDAAQIGEQPNTGTLRALLEDSELLPRQNSLPLLRNSQKSSEWALAIALRRLTDASIDSFHARARELAYLANVLRLAPSHDTESLTDDDARAAAFAICNLGLELITGARSNKIESELGKEPGLIRLFLRGWNALSSIRGRVVGAFAGALTRNSTLVPWLQSEATVGISDLRHAVEDERFEAAREATIFLTIAFDSKVCSAIAPLLDAIPRFSTLLDGDDNSQQARWIASKADLQTLERLLDSLRLKSAKRLER